MKKRLWFTVIFIICLFNNNTFAEIADFTEIQVEMNYDCINLYELHGMSLDAGILFNLEENFLLHFMAGCHITPSYLFSLGAKFEVGIGYIISGESDYADYYQVLIGDEYTYHEWGQSPVNYITTIDVGIRQYLLWAWGDTVELQWVGSESAFHDIEYNGTAQASIGYAGFTFASIFEVLVPIQEFSISVHGLAGYSWENGVTINRNRDTDEIFITPLEDNRFAYGVRAILRWYLFNIQIGWYDEHLLAEAGLGIRLDLF